MTIDVCTNMTDDELRAFAAVLIRQMTDEQLSALTFEIAKEVVTLTPNERTEALQKLRDLKKRSASHE